MSWSLPVSLTIGDTEYAIRTDYRDILNICRAFNDPDLPDGAKYEVMLQILYPDYDQIPVAQREEALKQGIDFINAGTTDSGEKPGPILMDWDQDERMIVSAINKVSGSGDIRALPYLHWWTFIGYYMEIGDGLFSQVLNIRYKRAHGKKLDKWEKDFEKENRALIRLKKTMSEGERERMEAEREALKELIG